MFWLGVNSGIQIVQYGNKLVQIRSAIKKVPQVLYISEKPGNNIDIVEVTLAKEDSNSDWNV